MSQVTQYVVAQALDARLAECTTGGDLNFEGTPYVPQAGTPYIAAQLSAYRRDPLSLGVGTFAASGIYVLRVNRPANGGLAMARQVAARLTVLFARGVALALASGQQLIIESASEEAAITSGAWVSVPVTVRWYVPE